ncbi:ABC protein [Guyanagaster necrorhizus]|uniref:ABC protein n=1 Tax=Guyanagaster necrorhizus TaxID=856835 RepID=A0A9P7W2P3_9AGAR|nr:ABC protein [Guyanagaster necrorhizus MCA 3950]KAG7451077.1 ABC protein [Guyanagaster necrorhizus MCA 3950]
MEEKAENTESTKGRDLDARHASIRLDLDAGVQKLRTRKRWWQLWLPNQVPLPPRTSLADAPVIPLEDASHLSKLTYSWITPMMVLGYRRTLQAPDLWKLNSSQESGLLSEQLDAAWDRRVKRAREWNMMLDSGKMRPSIMLRAFWMARSLTYGVNYHERLIFLENHWKTVSARQTPSLAWALNDVFGSMFWIGGAFKVLGDTAQLMGPLLVKAIINFAKARAADRSEGTEAPNVGRGIGMAIGLFCIVIVTSLASHQFFWRSMTTGVLARAALIHSIYKRGVVLTGKARTQFSNAAIINHISTDVSRIDAASQWFHAGWTAPIQVMVCLIILLVQLGPSVLAGFLLFLLVAPVQERLMAHRFSIGSRSMKFTDERANTFLEALGAMRIVKYFTYEEPLLERIDNVRNKELVGIRQMHHAQSANTAFAYSIPVLASTLAFVTYTSTTASFDAAIIFASLSLFNLLRQPMMFLPRALSVTADARNALKRLSGIFHAETMTEDSFVVNSQQGPALKVSDATFEWELPSSIAENDLTKLEDGISTEENADQPFRVSNINMEVPRKRLVAVVGRVGSGKSSLLQGLIGEMRKISGDLSFRGPVAYCPQTAWIQNATLRDNILFGQPLDEARYWGVVEKACLLPDLQMLPDGDLTEIGEKGINLSGGQKQRVNIARALYYNADVLLFDDPLSAVDAHVGKSLFHGAILPLVQEGKTVILVTHAVHFLSHCDYVYTLHNGCIIEQGTYQQLLADDGDFARLVTEFGGTSASSETSNINDDDGLEEIKSKSAQASGKGTGKLEGRLMVKERRTTGSLPWAVYRSYFTAGGGFLSAPFVALALILMQGSQILSSYTLVWWQANAFDRPFSFYQVLYAGLGLSQALFTMLLGISIDIMSSLISRNLHKSALWNIFHATMAFFDTTPMGRILGIFGKDIDSIDNQLPTSMRLFVITMSNVMGAVIIITVLEHYFIIAVFIIAFGYQYFASFYRASAREMRRLDGMLRSVLYAHLSESLTGLPTIRAYREIPRFLNDNCFYIDLENRALILTVTNQRWLAVRLDALGAVLVLCAAVFAVVGVSGISPAEIGLVLTYSTTLTQLCGMVTRQSAEVENYMNAVERVLSYSKGEVVDQEAPYQTDADKSTTQLTHGSIQFRDVAMSYRPGMPQVLRGITLDIQGGEKIGIVGRTGAGKSSLMLTLLRIVEYSGEIHIDRDDISKMGLKSLRSKMAIIPQDVGTVRSTLDPFSIYDDAKLWDALKRSFLVDEHPPTANSSTTEVEIHQNRITLDTVVEPEGLNFSVGQRSLLSLARALVKDTKIVILDEATASVDVETDQKIQQTIQHQFRDRTLLCIAHRLRTIISYDRVLVLEEGQIAEFDSPSNLFLHEDGIFRGLCDRSNISFDDIEQAVKST